MKKSLLTLLAALLCVANMWADESGSCGANLTWVYTESDHTLTISGIGDMYDYEIPNLDPESEYPSNSAPWSSYRYYISTIVLPNGLTSIGESAFYGCGEYPGLNVTIPNTVTHINGYAFADCAWLLEITIPDGVVSIGAFAFDDCHLMQTLVIPASVTNIDMFAFQATNDLTDVTVNWTSLDGVTIGAYIFNAVTTSKVNLHVPEGTEDMYAAASPWNAFNIVRPAASVTSVPTAITGLEYTGSAQELVNAGTASGGTLNYSLDNTNWSEDIPTGTNAGDYTVYYMVVGDDSHADYTPDDNFVNVSIASADMNITAKVDPQNAGVYYATFYHGTLKYALPDDGTEAYAAEVSGDALYLHKIAENDDVLPANTAVIFKATSNTITLTQTDNTPVTVSATNNLHGVDEETAVGSIPEAGNTIYVLSGEDGVVGFYKYVGATLGAHKAYIALDAEGAAKAPRRLVFHTDEEQGIEDVQNAVQSTKLIENGQLVIIKNGIRYNAQGQIVK